MDFLNDLNANQRAAVEYCDGPSLVIAGAGSGKTRVLTYKIAYLLSRGMKPWNILALTFTNKAANEMKQRIGALVGVDMARKLNMGTFHSVFSRILRVEAQLIEYEPNFTIYDEADSRSLVKAIIKEMHLDDKVYKPAMVHSRISMAKNHLIMPEVYAITQNLVERDKEQRIPAFSFIYSAYCARCKAANAMDFDDLLTNTFVLFDKYDDARLKYVDKSSEPATETEAGNCNAALDISDLRSGEHIVVVKAVYEDGSIVQSTPFSFQYNKPEENVQNLRVGLDPEKSEKVLLSWDSPEMVDDVLSLEIRMDGNGPISIRPDNTSFSFSMLGAESGEHVFSITAVYGGKVRSIAKVVLLYAAES